MITKRKKGKEWERGIRGKGYVIREIRERKGDQRGGKMTREGKGDQREERMIIERERVIREMVREEKGD